MVQVGSKATFGIISGSPKTDGSFINPTSMFNHDGYVMAWEVYAAKTGTVKLQVNILTLPTLAGLTYLLSPP